MQEWIVGPDEGGQRLDKYLRRRLPLAPASFFYRMLRKKNIRLGGKKADGSEKVETGDAVSLYLSDETIGKFSAPADPAEESRIRAEEKRALRLIGPMLGPDPVLYEDENVLIVRKPAGVLSQKASPSDVSMNEWLRGYLRGKMTRDQNPGDLAFRPSVCNRLDRNTGGILLCAVSLRGSRALSAVIRDRVIRKTYRMVVHGQVAEPGRIEGDLVKDQRENLVRAETRAAQDGADPILPVPGTCGRACLQRSAQSFGDPGQVRRHAVTVYRPVRTGREATIVEADLITGRSHQLRVHMASIGHPIVADPKYGSRERDRRLLQRSGDRQDGPPRRGGGSAKKTIRADQPRLPSLRGQLLWCAEVAFPDRAAGPWMEGVLAPLAGKVFRCPPPRWWERLAGGENDSAPYTQ